MAIALNGETGMAQNIVSTTRKVEHAGQRRAAKPADYAACLDMLRVGSKSFYAASKLLPKRLREPVYALYAFCRVADDAVDQGSSRAEVFADMRQRLAAIYEGGALSHPVDIAFAQTVARFAIPRELPEALFEGFEWDAAGRRYQTLSELRAYAVRVAGTVGAMMTLLMEVRSPEALARACDLGVAMQLTNIARDIGEDARAGRLYLPVDWFVAEGMDPDVWLANPEFKASIAGFTANLLHEAEVLYRRSERGIALLPADCRRAIWAARYIYAAIGAKITENAMDSISQRAYISKGRKLGLLGRAIIASVSGGVGAAQPCLSEAIFVMQAAERANPAQNGAIGAGELKIGWLFDLFERLERIDRYGSMDGQSEIRAV